MPERESKLPEPQIGRAIERSENRKLKSGVGEREKGENEPKTLETQDTAEAISQGDPDRVGPHDEEIPAEHAKEGKKSWRDGVLE
jgi:hypothetical protein